jgi:hypothetical protein
MPKSIKAASGRRPLESRSGESREVTGGAAAQESAGQRSFIARPRLSPSTSPFDKLRVVSTVEPLRAVSLSNGSGATRERRRRGEAARRRTSHARGKHGRYTSEAATRGGGARHTLGSASLRTPFCGL